MGLKEDLILDEGKRHTPYQDHLGNWTIGVGHLMSNPISNKAIMQILQDDIDVCIGQLSSNETFGDLNLKRQDVLINMCFNMGYKNLMGFKKMWAALKIKDFKTAAFEMLDSKWAGQVKGRAKRLAKEMKEG